MAGPLRQIGSYRLLRLLMTGQNSWVWEVFHDGRQQRYALKTLLPELSHDKEQVGYLKNEYLVGSTLDHPHVIKIHELGYHERVPFLVMEFFPFQNIKVYIQQQLDVLRPLVPGVIEQSAEGLAYFHEQNWIHRDIKPDNFLLSPEGGNVKLIDFALAQRKKTGLARLLAGKAKRIQGTRSYMSPEQIRGQSLDERSDIYSFGCAIHEMVAGKPPFTGADTHELLTKHLRSPPPSLAALDRQVTSDFAGLVQRMLSKKPADRPQSMEVFLREYRSLRIYKEPPRAASASRAS